MSRTAMGIDHLRETGMPDVSNPGGPQVGVPPADVGRWNQAPLGFIHGEPASQVPIEIDGTPQPIGLTGAGDQEWIYIYHEGLAGTTLAAGDVCVRDGLTAATGFGAAYADHSGAAASAGANVIGVAQYAIRAGFFGFILRKGPGVVNYGVAPTNGGRPLITTGAGAAIEGVATAAGFGVSVLGAIGVQNAILNCNG